MSKAFVASPDKPIAFLSDIHGDLVALTAVFEEIDRRDIKQVVAVGDLLLGGEHPLGVWRLLTERNVHCVRGLADMALASVPEQMVRRTVDEGGLGKDDQRDSDELQAKAEQFFQARAEIGDLVVRSLAKLPAKLRIPLPDGNELLAMHGSPFDPGEPMSFEMSDDELHTLIADDPADVVIAAGAHVAFERLLDGTRVHGLGAVCTHEAPPSGDEFAVPPGHTRVARFSVVTPRLTETGLEHAWVSF